MKRILAFVAATLMCAVASSVQAVETTVTVYLQTSAQTRVLVEDANIVVMDAEGNVVAENVDAATATFDLAAGAYSFAAEQESTALTGQVNAVVTEDGDNQVDIVLTPRKRVAVAPSTISSPATPVATTPVLPQAPVAGYGYSVGGTGNWGALALLGAVGGIIAVAVADDDHPRPVTPFCRYR